MTRRRAGPRASEATEDSSRETEPVEAVEFFQAAEPLAGSPVAGLQPRTGPQLLDAGFDVIRFRAKRIAALLAIFHGPFFVVSVLLLRHIGSDDLTEVVASRLWSHLGYGDRPIAHSEWWIAGSIACSLFGEMLFAVALATLMRGWLEGRDPAVLQVTRTVTRRLPTIFFALLLAGLLKVLGLAACLIGFVFVVPRLSILGSVIAFEPGGGPARCIARSSRLTNRAVAQALFLTVISPTLSILLALALHLTGAVSGFEQLGVIMAMVITLLLVVARCSATTLLYLDILVRTEGLDLTIRAPGVLGPTR